jgi:hypothetical protein
MPHFIQEHPYAAGFAICWLLSCFAESMPKPLSSNGPFYVWIFQFLHLTAGAIPRLVALTFPPQYARLFNSTMPPAPLPLEGPELPEQDQKK